VAPSERDTYGVICKGATLTPLANGFCFGEGPRWFEGLLWFSDMLGEAVHTVNLHGEVTKLALAGHAPSGLGFRPDGSLSDRRIFADGLDGPPDGIALDAEGGVWTSMTLAHQFDRVVEGGTVTDRIEIGDRTAIACTLGGPERRTLFMLSSTSAYPQRLVGTKLSRLDATTVDVPGQRMAAADTRHRGGRPCAYTAAASSGRGQKP
jgi:sugar lactone lactonase YvrE